MKADDCFNSSYEQVEFSLPPVSTPSGMSGATYAANLFGINLDTANGVRFRDCILQGVGANDFVNTYTAQISVNKAEAISFKGITFENALANTRHNDQLIRAASGTVSLSDIYIENVDNHSQTFLSWDNNGTEKESQWYIENMYITNLGTPTVFLSSQTQGIWDLSNVYAENLDISDDVFDFDGVPISSQLNNVKLENTMFMAGSFTGGVWDASSSTNSTEGLVSQSLVFNNYNGTGPTGFVLDGYTVSLGATFVDVTGGEAVINNQHVISSPVIDDARTTIRLFPILTGGATTWNVKISAFGSPYVEDQAALKNGSAFCPTIATFTTPGGGGAPAGLVSISFDSIFSLHTRRDSRP